ncbi:MAG: phenylalanine--tRNA ligase subunit alpha [Saprospiraceae bacterium]|nr:phenylalanine--tRNA ligase subunit alpha [Saprospiraceae bacterium]MBK8450547.1 phenylalanine--tRNA ligase subunit alpha [Saprospiraceae bacterium]MBK8485373.1 phenylalanine--tRNA ligase subunit alpha [Saprospiraceae bacterium]MBK9222589.1 phenylalanine--tRNA ligase subunit alpha [Saprospiraceae bacterium]MBK9720378.1 phenylalanine--tRNA ligase subunit alpha [Saprospiraceae bacterium]
MSQDWFAEIKRLIDEIKSIQIEDQDSLEQFRLQFLGSKNRIKPLFSEIGKVPNELKKEYGQFVNEAKSLAESKYAAQIHLKEGKQNATDNQLDWSLPPVNIAGGTRHPISIVMDRIVDIFSKIGFEVVEDREIEDDWHNFTALNTPDDHPARDMQDTYYVRDFAQRLLRTHTSSVQSRFMTKNQPPIRILAPGRVYRNETISARSHCQFHQVEGLYLDKKVSMADLKQTLLFFAKEMYGSNVNIRLRPSYFPFTEPSAEMDIYWGLKDETDHRITKGTGWLEILGCGMVDPAVLDNCGIDSNVYSGFAFGMGIERQAMLLYKIPDIRYFFENDLRFLKQF